MVEPIIIKPDNPPQNYEQTPVITNNINPSQETRHKPKILNSALAGNLACFGLIMLGNILILLVSYYTSYGTVLPWLLMLTVPLAMCSLLLCIFFLIYNTLKRLTFKN